MSHCIIAYLGEGDRFWPVIERATSIAMRRHSRLIFYDTDAASRLGANPLPTFWSADGLREQFGDRLGPAELERAGCEELRDRVQRARHDGIDAYGWLPSKRGAKDLAEYATAQGADLLVVPADLEPHGLAEWFKGLPSAREVAGETHLPLVVVELKQAV